MGVVQMEELQDELADAKAQLAYMRGYIESHHPESPLLGLSDIGREFLDRLTIAEASSNDSLVEGLFELRDSLKLSLGFFVVTGSNKKTFSQLKAVLNRWGDIHLRVLSKGDTNAQRDSKQKEESELSKVRSGGNGGSTRRSKGRRRS